MRPPPFICRFRRDDAIFAAFAGKSTAPTANLRTAESNLRRLFSISFQKAYGCRTAMQLICAASGERLKLPAACLGKPCCGGFDCSAP